MEDSSNTIVDVREELMVSPTGGNPTLRIAHFLRPSTTTIKEPFFEIPSLPPSLPPNLEPQKRSLTVSFSGWRYRHNNWPTWVDQMASLHQSTWKKAGIYEAVLSSMYQIRKDNNLVFGIAEKWCSESKTFIFPWGEATITLEDTIILGNYSVLGDSVLSPLESEKLKEIEEKLKEGRRELTRSKSKKASPGLWVKKFMESGSEIEHEAFLACWLSRYVFQTGHDTISERVFSIAIHLSRGKRIALAPAVLASIYRDLNLLKEKIVASNTLGTSEDGALEVYLFSPFHLVQIWVWERFLELRPKSSVINYGDPRMARWDKVNGLKVENMRLALDSAGENFQWRPYTTALNDWHFPKFYAEKESWVLVIPGLDEEFLSFARCLRASELVGLGCIEQYLPHRVAMQFGLDQDLPGCVARFDETPEVAWKDYNNPIGVVILYIPSRLFEADVTTRYLEWWKQSVIGEQDAIKGNVLHGKGKKGADNCKRSKGSPKSSTVKNEAYDHCFPQKSSKKSLESLKGKKGANDALVPPGFPPRNSEQSGQCSKAKKEANDPAGLPPKNLESSLQGSKGKKGANCVIPPPGFPTKRSKGLLHKSKGKKKSNNSLVPAGSPSKLNRGEVGDSIMDDDLTIAEMWKLIKKHDNVAIRKGGDGGNPIGQLQSPLSSNADNGATKNMGSLEKVIQSEGGIRGSKTVRTMENAIESKAVSSVYEKVTEREMENTNESKAGGPFDTTMSINGIKDEGCSYTLKVPGLELEARICRLEKLVAELKAERSN